MSRLPFTTSCVAAACLMAASAAGAGGSATRISASPFSITLNGKAMGIVTVRNPSATPVTLDVGTGDFTVGVKGDVHVDPAKTPQRSARAWLSVSPKRLELAPHSVGNVTVTSNPERGAAAGDYHALVLLATESPARTLVGVRSQLGVSVIVRVGGALRRDLRLGAPSIVRRGNTRALQLAVTNSGNVDEQLRRGAIRIVVRTAHGTQRITPGAVDVLPAASQELVVALNRRASGRATVTATVTPAATAGLPPLAAFSVHWELQL